MATYAARLLTLNVLLEVDEGVRIPGMAVNGYQVSLPALFQGVHADEQPGQAVPSALAGVHAHGFGHLLFNWVYCDPLEIDVKSMSQDVTHAVQLWNAGTVPLAGRWYLEDADGIRPGLPEHFTLGGLRTTVVDVTFLMEGSPFFDGYLVFDFGEIVVRLRVVGSRIVAWPWRPQTHMLERLEWLTDILTSRDGSEQRLRLRNAPRQSWSMRTILRETIDNQSAEVALRAWQARPYMLPLWQDQVDMPPPPQDAQSLAFDTTDGAFATGPALIIWESPQTWQLCHVLHVRPDGVDIDPPITTAFTRPCLALPSVLARLLQGAERADRAVRVSDMSLVFSAVKPQDSPGQASPVQYRGQDVELLPLLLSGTTLARRIERGFDVVDYDVGSLDVFDPVRFSVVTFERRFMLETRQDIRDFRAFLYRRGGRVRPFWYPSMREDVTLLADIRTQETELKIRDCGYARLVNDLPGLRDIMIETHDGRRWFRRVAPGGMAGSGSESAETLLLDTPLPVAVPRAEVRRVCWLALLRLDADAVEMEWRTTWQVRSAIPVREIR